MFAMLKEIAICMVFLYIVLTIAYANRDPWSFYQFQNYENILNGGTFSKSIGNYTVSFVDVSNAFFSEKLHVCSNDKFHCLCLFLKNELIFF